MHIHHSLFFKGALLFTGLLLLQSCLTQKLEKMAPVEHYADDNWLLNQTRKQALIIVAHDDDAISSAGTVSMLTANGWEVHMLCFYHDIPENVTRNLQRQQDVQQATGGERGHQTGQPQDKQNHDKGVQHGDLQQVEQPWRSRPLPSADSQHGC